MINGNGETIMCVILRAIALTLNLVADAICRSNNKKEA